MKVLEVDGELRAEATAQIGNVRQRAVKRTEGMAGMWMTDGWRVDDLDDPSLCAKKPHSSHETRILSLYWRFWKRRAA